MLVSVIIPNYNHERFLVKRIESVLNQTYRDFEVIILDDCSTDKSMPIIDRYAEHEKVSQVIRNEENSGSSFAQWRKGIAAAKGALIWLAESDDYADPQFLEILVGRFAIYPTANVIYCESNVVDESDHFLYRCATTLYAKYDPNKWLKDYFNKGSAEIKEVLYRENVISNASSVLFRRDAWDKLNTEELVHMRYAGDWLLWSRMLQQGDIVYVATPLNYFRTHAATTRSAPKDIDKVILLVNEMNKVLADLSSYIDAKAARAKFLENLDVFAANIKIRELSHIKQLVDKVDSLSYYSRKFMLRYVLNKRLGLMMASIEKRFKRK